MQVWVFENTVALENQHKVNPSIELDKIKSDIALVDAQLVAKDIMFSKQQVYEFIDQPGRHLVKVLM